MDGMKILNSLGCVVRLCLYCCIWKGRGVLRDLRSLSRTVVLP